MICVNDTVSGGQRNQTRVPAVNTTSSFASNSKSHDITYPASPVCDKENQVPGNFLRTNRCIFLFVCPNQY